MTTPRSNVRRALISTACALLAAGLAACSSNRSGPSGTSPDGGAPAAPIHVGGITAITDSSQLTFPIDAYLMTDQQFVEVESATDVLTAQCMSKFGFDYRPAVKNTGAGKGTSTNAARRYGVVDAAAVAVLGYHAPNSGAADARTAEPALDAAGRRVLTGGAGPGTQSAAPTATAGTYQGMQIPPGGCLTQARAELTAHGGTVNDSPVAQGVNVDSVARSQQEPQVVAVFKQWSACMQAHGYSYATPYDAINDHRWRTPQPSAAEIQVATADVACKQKANVVGVWYAVDCALQTSMIDARQQQLDGVRDGIAQELKAAARVVGTVG
ncbi:MAG: hypothetical protein ACRDVE_01900 [Actinocrinis sp.]